MAKEPQSNRIFKGREGSSANQERLKGHSPQKNNSPFSFSWIAIIVRGIVGTCISLFLYSQVHRIEDEDTMYRFLLLSKSHSRMIQKELDTVTEELRMAGIYLRDNTPLSTEGQESLLATLFQNAPYISHVQWLPLEKNPLSLSPTEKTARIKAIAEKKPTTAESAQAAPPLATLFIPIIKADETVAGTMQAEISIALIVKDTFLDSYSNAVNIYIFDSSLGNKNFLLYFYDAEPAVSKKVPSTPQNLNLDEFSTQNLIHIGDREWLFVYNTTKSFSVHTWQGAIAALIGFFITTFIVVTAWVLLEIEKRQYSHVLHEEHIQEMEGTFDKLESTRNCLLAQHNLASLGGLTAGIAHEINNPLNFINNFSSLSEELIEVIDSHIHKFTTPGDEDSDEVLEALENLKNNIHTIHDQGEKADNTIQRMLAHSRGKPGEWVKTDVHKLLDEYIAFSFHGMRAKNPSFNVKIEKEFDISVQEVEVVANDIGRVFLNLLNNAFQAIDDKKKKVGDSFVDPKVTVMTQRVGSYFRVRICDNGIGISEENKSRIFTPFFTTKPSGVGTGLGLSLCYNIIVSEHRGLITFQTNEGEYCEFIVTVPLRTKIERASTKA